MKRAWVALALLLVACGGSNAGEKSAGTPTSRSRPTTTTAVDPETGFDQRLDVRLTDEDAVWRAKAADLAKSMCDTLDSTANGPGADDAANDTPASDAIISSSLTLMALDAAADTGMDPAVTAEVLTSGADFFCPEYSQLVSDYAAAKLG